MIFKKKLCEEIEIELKKEYSELKLEYHRTLSLFIIENYFAMNFNICGFYNKKFEIERINNLSYYNSTNYSQIVYVKELGFNFIKNLKSTLQKLDFNYMIAISVYNKKFWDKCDFKSINKSNSNIWIYNLYD